MATVRQILRRREERSNLNAMGVCVLVVIGVTAVAFMLINLSPGVPGGYRHSSNHPTTASLNGETLMERAW
ncbi:MAG: hypothetical protein O2954_20290 [bacterium]|nr:hypothetical protein [bacterium]